MLKAPYYIIFKYVILLLKAPHYIIFKYVILLFTEGFEELPLAAFDTRGSFKVDSRQTDYQANLVVQPEYLKPGVTYKLMLYASHSVSDAEAEIDVVVNGPPECKSLDVSYTIYSYKNC